MISSVSVYGSFKVTEIMMKKWLIDEAYNYFYVLRNIAHVIISMIVLWVIVKMNYQIFEKYSKHIFWFCLAMLIYVLISWMTLKWANGWINIPGIPFTIQPTEFLKLGLIVYLAAFLKKYKGKIHMFHDGFLPFIIIIWIVTILVWLQPDFGTIMVILPVSVIMFYFAWMNIKHLLISILLGFFLITTVYLSWKYDKENPETRVKTSYITDRIDNFLDDNKEAIKNKTINYQTEQALIAIWSWWFNGLWFWGSIQKFGYLPEVQWDFIFSVIVEELGFLWGILLISFYGYIVSRWIIIATHVSDLFWKFVAIWVSSRIWIQAFINIWVNLNIVPLTWITLPFISYWWSSLLWLMIALAILLNISRFQDKTEGVSRWNRNKLVF